MTACFGRWLIAYCVEIMMKLNSAASTLLLVAYVLSGGSPEVRFPLAHLVRFLSPSWGSSRQAALNTLLQRGLLAAWWVEGHQANYYSITAQGVAFIEEKRHTEVQFRAYYRL
jgi:hypothetical protein